jgi:hypothetical protein
VKPTALILGPSAGLREPRSTPPGLLFAILLPMDRGRSEVRCIVREGELVVSLPGDDFCAVYHKPTTQPQLILKRRTQTDDYVVLARAWQAANDKARELGWIV